MGEGEKVDLGRRRKRQTRSAPKDFGDKFTERTRRMGRKRRGKSTNIRRFPSFLRDWMGLPSQTDRSKWGEENKKTGSTGIKEDRYVGS